jgi:lysozyme
MRGIDVSDNNGEVNWQAVADSGVGFVMVACSYGKTGRHDRFAENVNGAHAVGLKVGAYHYSYALTPEDALKEVENCKAAIDEAGVALELPVFFDMEDADHWKEKHDFDFSPENVTAICKNFVDNIGLNTGVYASLGWLQNYIDWQGLGCAVWNAEWIKPNEALEDNSDGDSIKGYLWQYTDKFVIGDKEFDGNILY